MFVERAVRTDLVTEREMEIEAERFGHGVVLTGVGRGERQILKGCVFV